MHTATENKGDLRDLALFAGFFAAHTILQIENGKKVVPLQATLINGQKQFERFDGEDATEQQEKARHRFEDVKNDYDFALYTYSSDLTKDGADTQAIYVVAAGKNMHLKVAIPYSGEGANTSISMPKLIESNISDLTAFFAAFYQGIETHVRAAQFWNAHLNKSI